MTSIDSLRNVLELECQKGYTDKAVIGGLDRYLHKQAVQIRQNINNPQLVGSFDELDLANSMYGSYDTDERKRWIKNVFSWLDKLERAKGETAIAAMPERTRFPKTRSKCRQPKTLRRTS